MFSQSIIDGEGHVRRVMVIRAPSRWPGFLNNLARLAHYRDLIYTLSLHRIKVRYKQTALGASWAILQPVSLMLVHTLIFSGIAKMPSNGAPYAIFVYSALLLWMFFSSALGSATNALVTNNSLITKVYFPREILPMRRGERHPSSARARRSRLAYGTRRNAGCPMSSSSCSSIRKREGSCTPSARRLSTKSRSIWSPARGR